MLPLEKIDELERVIGALCEYHRRCPTCYNIMNGGDCVPCKNYYGECICTPLTPEQIIDGVDT